VKQSFRHALSNEDHSMSRFTQGIHALNAKT
jgi:hypothetical protein